MACCRHHHRFDPRALVQALSAFPRWLSHPYLLLTLTTLFWAGNWVVGRGMRADVPPIALAFWRWVVALLCALPFAWPHLKHQWPEIRANWRILFLLGAIGTALYNALTYIGLQYTTATNGVLLNAFIPVAIMGLSWGVLGKRLSQREIMGIVLSFLGVTLIVSRGSWQTLLALELNRGDLWILASVLGWAVYTLLVPKRPARLHPTAFLVTIAAIGLLIMAPAYLWELASGRHIVWSTPAAIGIVYTGVFPAFLGYVLWNHAVTEVGGNTAGVFIHLMPVFGIILSALFLGEAPQSYHAAAIVLIVGGIAVATLARRH